MSIEKSSLDLSTTNKQNKQKMESVKILTIKDLKGKDLNSLLDYYQDLACNIDYILQPIESGIVHKNINLIESVLIHKEF